VTPLYVTAYSIVCAAGQGKEEVMLSLREHKGGLVANDFGYATLDTYIGKVSGIESVRLPQSLEGFDCRNNRLAEMTLLQDDFAAKTQALLQRVDSSRIGLFLGTSTSGTLTTEMAYRDCFLEKKFPADYSYQKTHDINSVTEYTKQRLGISGPAFTLSTACSSSAKVFCEAERFIAAGLCDAAIVGGVDSLCYNTLFGFNSLQLISAKKCRPFDAARDGISIGEAGGFMILEKQPENDAKIMFAGYGESSDAYHISTPHPDGLGAKKAMQSAMAKATLKSDAIRYINLHGTATLSNDKSEAAAIAALFSDQTLCSSTKGWTGHTLGAAGIIEAIISCISLEAGFIPGTLNTLKPDSELAINLALDTQSADCSYALSNSFGFGGTNCSLIFGRT